jgi:hypothetical protein
MSYSTVRKIYQSDLPAYPYKIQLSQPLIPNAKEQRFQFAMDFNALLEREPDITGKIWFSDNAHFHLDRYTLISRMQDLELWNTHMLLLTIRYIHRGSPCGVHSLYVAFLGQCFSTEPSQVT